MTQCASKNSTWDLRAAILASWKLYAVEVTDGLHEWCDDQLHRMVGGEGGEEVVA